ncbi:MAG: helix-turn-helix domain-containing protein [Gracilibacteraceae bacterium]|jgi:repressor LexA|nr:helix-turn-helix domain-containing protein [Gracilibacteraceae bacterium]
MFSKRLREARKNKGLTQQQLGKAIGVAKSTIAGYESGHSEPDTAKIALIVKALDIEPNFLWQDEFDGRTTLEEKSLLARYRGLNQTNRQLLMTIADVITDVRQPELPRKLKLIKTAEPISKDTETVD